MRNPGIIRCKDCLAWDLEMYESEDEDVCDSLCRVHPVQDNNEKDSDNPMTNAYSFCLQAVPKNPGTCEDCCYWGESEDRPERPVDHMWRGHCRYNIEGIMKYASDNCRRWRPCAESEGEDE